MTVTIRTYTVLAALCKHFWKEKYTVYKHNMIDISFVAFHNTIDPSFHDLRFGKHVIFLQYS